MCYTPGLYHFLAIGGDHIVGNTWSRQTKEGSMTANEPDGIPKEHRRRGPGIGEGFPDVRLPDQTGAIVDLHKERGGRRALVVFYRSARW